VARRRESVRLFVRGVAAHEAIPGHHLHFSRGRANGSTLLQLGWDPATTEGWGLFIEGVLQRAGYFDDPKEARAVPLRMRKWRAVRVILDVGIHARGLDVKEAAARLSREVAFELPVAEDEVGRYKDRPAYYACYLIGARRFEALEERAHARGGEPAARALRDELARLGPAAPLDAIERLVGNGE
jgi:uncharacterized protein (DUF885 family)